MIEKIKDYSILVLVSALAILAYLFGRRGEKIRDLQSEIVKKDLDATLKRAQDNVTKDKKSYEDALNAYIAKRNRYNEMYKR